MGAGATWPPFRGLNACSSNSGDVSGSCRMATRRPATSASRSRLRQAAPSSAGYHRPRRPRGPSRHLAKCPGTALLATQAAKARVLASLRWPARPQPPARHLGRRYGQNPKCAVWDQSFRPGPSVHYHDPVTESSLHPWDRAAPERTGKPSAYALLPEDFVALAAPGRAEHLFGQCQHPWAWVDERPRLSRVIREWMTRNLDLSLPGILERNLSEDRSTVDGHRAPRDSDALTTGWSTPRG
jgi:hypothetical protein